jgi:hypothetical protein
MIQNKIFFFKSKKKKKTGPKNRTKRYIKIPPQKNLIN